MTDAIMTKFENIKNMIGNTPLLEFTLKYKGKQMVVYAKAEYMNLSGSIKDRVAYYIMKKAYTLIELLSVIIIPSGIVVY